MAERDSRAATTGTGMARSRRQPGTIRTCWYQLSRMEWIGFVETPPMAVPTTPCTRRPRATGQVRCAETGGVQQVAAPWLAAGPDADVGACLVLSRLAT